MTEFTLTIKLGNEAMQDGADIADALREVVFQLEMEDSTYGLIFDRNGNRVGSYTLPE